MNVSVIVPVYNGADFVIRCLDSILPQLDADSEAIVIDDGSTDGTFNLLMDRYRHDDRVILVRLTVDMGVSVARNTGIRLARGDLITFCDADDEWKPGKLETQVRFLKEHPTIQMIFVGDETVVDDTSDRTERLALQSVADKVHFRCAMIRKTVFDTVGLLDEDMRIREDTEWLVRARTNSIAAEYLDEPLYVRHLRSTGLSAGVGEDSRKQRIIDSFMKGIRRTRLEGKIPYDLSILVPVFNAEKYVVEAIQSCSSIKYRSELILVDDGSADHSLDILCGYLSSMSGSQNCEDGNVMPVTLIHRKHKGQASSRNDAFNVSRGQYLLYLDADDYFNDGAIDAMMDAATASPDAFIISSMCRDFISQDLSEEEASVLKTNPVSYRRMLSGCMLIRRDTFATVGQYDENMATSETAQWVMRIRDAHLLIREIDYVTLARRYHKANLGRISRDAQMQSYMNMIRNRLNRRGIE